MTTEEMPKSLDHVWSEQDLCAKLNLPIVKTTGRSRQLSNWVRGGLRYAEKSGRRFFFEADVLEYIWERRNKGDKERPSLS